MRQLQGLLLGAQAAQRPLAAHLGALQQHQQEVRDACERIRQLEQSATLNQQQQEAAQQEQRAAAIAAEWWAMTEPWIINPYTQEKVWLLSDSAHLIKASASKAFIVRLSVAAAAVWPYHSRDKAALSKSVSSLGALRLRQRLCCAPTA